MTKFWKILLIALLAGSVFSCGDDDDIKAPKTETEVDIEADPGVTLVGRVLDEGGAPVVDAVVSDGFSITTTNNQGVYQIKRKSKAEFVFVSIPAEYEIPVENGLPKIYESLGQFKPGKVIQRNFTLKKTGKQSQFTLIALADVQIGQAQDIDSLKTQIPLIAEYVKTLSKPVYGMSLGDIVWDNMPYFAEYTKHITQIGAPIFAVIGNHDHNEKVTKDEGSDADFKANFGPTYYSYNIGDVHFVVLDDVYYEGRANYKGRITEQQLKWLEEDLKYVSKDKLIILGVHIPTLRRYNTNSKIENNQELYDLLDGYKVHILSGHHHANVTTTISDNIEENSLSAAMGAFWTGDLCTDGTHRGYAVYEIDGNKISNWYYKGTEHSKDYQMYLYGPGEAVSAKYQDGIVANIFNWHSTWTVNVYENGTLTTNLTNNFKEMDRRAYDYLYGSDKPNYRPSTEPETNNDHMLYYKPTDSWTTVTIEAIDPYGNKYTETIQK
ncbi:MAG: calcineurin-like phosphoesterase family protein [Dysgonomonas sp.]|nr:calcineurin-like phosphoesterase family protein [Dysgonomonas sp.]